MAFRKTNILEMISHQKNVPLTKEVQYGSYQIRLEEKKNEHVMYLKERLFLFHFSQVNVVTTIHQSKMMRIYVDVVWQEMSMG